MVESICEECIHMMDIDYDVGGLYKCNLCSDVEVKRVNKCSHFNPKPIVSNELKERRIKALKTGKEPRKKRCKHKYEPTDNIKFMECSECGERIDIDKTWKELEKKAKHS